MTIALGGNPPQPLRDVAILDGALTGSATGQIDAPDAIRTNATALRLKLLSVGPALIGRLLAIADRPGELAALPYVITLRRVS
jgi:hypothetical protein